MSALHDVAVPRPDVNEVEVLDTLTEAARSYCARLSALVILMLMGHNSSDKGISELG